MAAMLDGLLPSRRRPSRSRSESGKQLHARWGDAAISAPNGGGWNHRYLEDDLNSVVYQAHGSPDSQKTLVNTSPDLSYEKDNIEKVLVEEIRQPTPPVAQKDKERSAITITIPLPWSRKSHRRSSSTSSNQLPGMVQPVEKVVTAESRPALINIKNKIDEVIIAESRPVAEPFPTPSPVVQTQSPVYDDVSTFFTRAAFPEKRYAATSLPQIQTAVQPAESQPASGLSVLSPVAETYNGISESNNATPMDNTPIAQHIGTPVPIGDGGVINVENVTARLEGFARTSPPILPSSRITSPIEASDSDAERPGSRNKARFPSRPPSRGPGIGEVAYMRTSSRGPASRSQSQGPTEGRRSASREPIGRQTVSVEPVGKRALSREPVRPRAESPERYAAGRSSSRDLVSYRQQSREPVGRRDLSREPIERRAESPRPTTRRALSREPAEQSPKPATRRAQSREPSVRRESSPMVFGRRAISREPVSRRRISGDFSRRAASVDLIGRRASPRDDIIPRCGTPITALKAGHLSSSSDSSFADELTFDEATDIETETDEMYFKSRKGWYGPAVASITSRGFYDDVKSEYGAIARDVQAEQTGDVPATGINIVTLIKKDKEKEKDMDKEKDKEKDIEKDIEKDKEKDKEREGQKEKEKDQHQYLYLYQQVKYKGPDLVPSSEDLWG